MLSGSPTLSIIPSTIPGARYMLEASDVGTALPITNMQFSAGFTLGTVYASTGAGDYGGFVSGGDFFQPIPNGVVSDPETFTVTINFGSGSPDTASLPVANNIAELDANFNGTVGNESLGLSASGVVALNGTAPDISFFQDANNDQTFTFGTDTLLATVGAGADGSYNYSVPLGSSFSPTTYFAVATNSDGSSVNSGAVAVAVATPALSIGTLSASTDDSTGSRLLRLTANDVENAQTVSFYLNSPGSGTLLGTADGSDGWSITVDPSLLSGTPEMINARATDQFGNHVDATSLPLMADVIGSASANSGSNVYTSGGTIELSASGILDWNGDSISSVAFYPEDPGNPGHPSSTALSGTVTQTGDTWTLDAFTPSGSGTQLYWAQAIDSGGTYSNYFPITVSEETGPTVDSLTASTDSSTGSALLRLSADAFDSAGSITQVEFKMDGSSLGIVTNPVNGWTWNVDPSVWITAGSGPHDFTAVATNNFGQTATSPTLTVKPLLIGAVSASSGSGTSGNTYVAGQDLTLTASGLLDWNTSGGGAASVTGVDFYLDDGSGSFSTTHPLGSASPSGNDWTLPSVSTSGWTDPKLIWAVAHDNASSYYDSDPVALRVSPAQAPSITGLTASTDNSTGSTLLRLSTVGVSGPDVPLDTLQFYIDGISGPNLLGTINNPGGDASWNVDMNTVALAGSGPHDFWVEVTDVLGQTATTHLTFQPVVVSAAAADGGDGLYVAGNDLPLSASGLLTWNLTSGSPSSITNVEFFLDNGTNDFSSAHSLGSATSPTDGVWSINASGTSGTYQTSTWVGPQRIWVRAQDNSGGSYSYSDPISFIVYPNQPPTITGITAATDSSTGTTLLSLTANGVDDADDGAATVDFYLGSTAGAHLGTATAATNWTITGVDPSGWSSYQAVVARVTDTAGQHADASFSFDPIAIGQLTANSGCSTSPTIPRSTSPPAAFSIGPATPSTNSISTKTSAGLAFLITTRSFIWGW